MRIKVFGEATIFKKRSAPFLESLASEQPLRPLSSWKSIKYNRIY